MGGKKSNINQNKKIFNGFFFNQQTQVKNTRVIILYTFLQVRHIIKHIFTQVPTIVQAVSAQKGLIVHFVNSQRAFAHVFKML